jgi:ferritin-like metal-binding protein YciE
MAATLSGTGRRIAGTAPRTRRRFDREADAIPVVAATPRGDSSLDPPNVGGVDSSNRSPHTPRSRPMPLKSLDDLLIHQLKELHAAERHNSEALPALAKSATDPDLKSFLEKHGKESKEHLGRLVDQLEELGAKAPSARAESKGMKGLVEDCMEIAKAAKHESHVRDAAIIGAVQHVEHDEIAGYGCACAWAKIVGNAPMANDLEKTLEAERRADAELTLIAEGINKKAAAATPA